jgi:predicted HicB family RNase H-like nuclease
VAVLRPARRHGIPGEDIRRAVNHAITIEEAGDDPAAAEGRARTAMNDRGRRTDGTPVTGADVEAMADEAERGYDVDTLLRRRRRGGRPPLGSAAASVESVRLDPELKRALLIRAAEEHVSVSEVIRRAIGEYLRAS